MSRGKNREDDGPMLGALLRLAYHALAQELADWLVEAGYEDLQPTHSAALQSLWARPEGVRLTAMAQTAHVTKQTMSALVDHLERTGYVERVADPDDGRAARVRLTARGETFTRGARAFSRRVESQLDARLGPERVEALRATLRLIHEAYGRD
jgi:DNA-binding MarR family transcriptional regulator